ncbi:MAG: YfhO family protein, partial [Nitrososphaerales archaeon]
ATGTSAVPAPVTFLPRSEFCPIVKSVSVARLFGVSYVLETPTTPAPKGAVFDEEVGGERLYRVPGAAAATLTPLPATGDFPRDDAAGVPVQVQDPDSSAWRIDIDSAKAQVLRLRLDDVPGWHATIDGRPLELYSFDGAMLQARIPPGRHTVQLRYWPATFTAGIVLAILAALGLLVAAVVARIATKRRAPSIQ